MCDLTNFSPECKFDEGDCNENDNISKYQIQLCKLILQFQIFTVGSKVALVAALGRNNAAMSDFQVLKLNSQNAYWLPKFPFPLETPIAVITEDLRIFVCGGTDINGKNSPKCHKYYLTARLYSPWRKAPTLLETKNSGSCYYCFQTSRY